MQDQNEQNALAPKIILDPFQALQAMLMHLRTNTGQEAIAEVMGASQPTISRVIAVVIRIIARVLGPLLATAEQVLRTGAHIIDGTLLPCWSWKDQQGLSSGKHKRTGVNLQIMVGLGGRLLWTCDPLPGSVHDAKAIATSGILELIDPSQCITDKGYTETGITAPQR